MKAQRYAAVALSGAVLLLAHSAKSELRHDDPIYWSDKDWAVYSYPSESMCEMSTRGPKGEYFTFAVFPTRDARFINLAVPDQKRYLEGDTSGVKLIFLPITDKWSNVDFSISKADGYASFRSDNIPDTVEDDLVQSDALIVADLTMPRASGSIGAISLRGAKTAVTHLRECVSKLGQR